jgi:GT2 family glycosyltransferase
VSIVVVTWNNLTFNRLCIESVLEHTQLPEYELIVVDNCSVDGTRAYLDQRAEVDPRVRVIRNDGNVGFVKAANIGLRAARGNVLVLLNNDTIVAPGWLVRLSAYATRPEVGMVGPVSNQVSGEARVPISYRTYGEYLDCARSFLERGQPREAGMLTLFCAAMRRDVYEQVGPLDERFVVGMFEDDDYSMRIREAGHVLMCADDVLVHHFGEASFGNLVPSGDYKLLFDENRSRFEEKWGVTWLSRRNRPDPVYDETRERLRSLIATETSGQDKVAIVTRGDDALLEQAGRRTCHFPSTAEGAYAGGYPKDSAEAIKQIRELSKGGCTHLVFPESSRWWLDHYEDLRSWLEGEATMVANQQGTGVIYSLSGDKHDVVTHAVSAR